MIVFDWFATHDGAPYQSFSRALEQLETIISYEKESGLSAYSNQRTKDNGFEGKYSCKCKQSIHFGVVIASKLEKT
jgi:hypothetical protein